MTAILIVLLLVIGVILVASLALGRVSYEVESARDTEYLEVEGTWVRYDIIGGGPPVLLVHGWLSSSRIWEQLAARLAQRFTVYTLDLSGFGESDKPLSGYGVRDRKSTRLNSSHANISYAVFCLKKKKKTNS